MLQNLIPAPVLIFLKPAPGRYSRSLLPACPGFWVRGLPYRNIPGFIPVAVSGTYGGVSPCAQSLSGWFVVTKLVRIYESFQAVNQI